ncbi:MAG: hypothetical protein PHC28_11630 [Flavobacterium sp.]|uniref:hypothetical protein n=1 Tax=Flavobacterium sp. TaxID=239 RepID=UPI00261B7652|nr:hypothetical protein [Flavobacterium sp.]MDD5151103.1 hypothetical protein [Flavobacterium sp.]
MKSFAVLIPEGLDIEDLVSVHSPNLDPDYLKYLIHLVLSKIAFTYKENDSKERIKFSGIKEVYKPINSKKILVAHAKHKEHIDFLRANSFKFTLRKSRTRYEEIELSVFYSKRFIQGKTSYSYKLNPIFLKQRLKVEYITAPKLIKKVKDSFTVLPSVVRNGKYRFLGKYFDKDRLKINFDEAVCFCEERYLEHKDYGKYVNELNQLVDLKNGCYRIYNVLDKDGRIHSNITKLPKVYRRFLTYDDKKLAEVDLSNSIIYFIAMIINNHIKEDRININYSLNPLTVAKTLESLDMIEKELLEEKSVSGEFYELFISDFKSTFNWYKLKCMFKSVSNDEFNGSYKQVRKIAKKYLLAMIFADIDSYKEVQDIFRKKFPNLLDALILFKKKFGYKSLSYLLFQMESCLMLDKVARRFNARHWRVAPIFSLHDCLITTVDYERKLEIILKEVFIEEFDIAPKVETAPW